jgi:hypothetical protein
MACWGWYIFTWFVGLGILSALSNGDVVWEDEYPGDEGERLKPVGLRDGGGLAGPFILPSGGV